LAQVRAPRPWHLRVPPSRNAPRKALRLSPLAQQMAPIAQPCLCALRVTDEPARSATLADVRTVCGEALQEVGQRIEKLWENHARALDALLRQEERQHFLLQELVARQAGDGGASAEARSGEGHCDSWERVVDASPQSGTCADEAIEGIAADVRIGAAAIGCDGSEEIIAATSMRGGERALAATGSQAAYGDGGLSQPEPAAARAGALQPQQPHLQSQQLQAQSYLQPPQRWQWPSGKYLSSMRLPAMPVTPESWTSFGSWRKDRDVGDLRRARSDVRRALGLEWTELSHSGPQLSPPSSSPRHQRFERAVSSPTFDNICGAVIICNAFCVGLQANQRAAFPLEPCRGAWAVVNLVFSTFFVVELGLRLSALGRRFFLGADWHWNLCDLVIVLFAVGEEAAQRLLTSSGCSSDHADLGNGVTALRIIRMLRLVRIIRAIRVVQLFRELRVMVQSILRCLVPFCWACFLLLGIHWCFGVYFVHISSDYIADGVRRDGVAWLEDDSVARLREHYGSLWRALYTLFLSITGGMDWGGAADPLAVTGYQHMLLYTFFVALTMFAVLNVVTGVFVQSATKIALHDRDLVIQDQLRWQKDYIKAALRIFHEADLDGDGKISRVEFEAHLEDERVQAFFNCLELTGVEARRLFRLLDIDGNGTVDAEEFVTGCMCLKGGAKTMDVAALMLEQGKFMDYVHDQFQLLFTQAGPTAGSHGGPSPASPSARWHQQQDGVAPTTAPRNAAR